MADLLPCDPCVWEIEDVFESRSDSRFPAMVRLRCKWCQYTTSYVRADLIPTNDAAVEKAVAGLRERMTTTGHSDGDVL